MKSKNPQRKPETKRSTHEQPKRLEQLDDKDLGQVTGGFGNSGPIVNGG